MTYDFMKDLEINLLKGMLFDIKALKLSLLEACCFDIIRFYLETVNLRVYDIMFPKHIVFYKTLKRHPRLRDLEKAKG